MHPKPGDELAVFNGGKRRWWRKVIAVDYGVLYVTSAGKNKWQTLWRWQDQMRNATIEAAQ